MPHSGAGAWRAEATGIADFAVSSGFTQLPLPLTRAEYHSEYSFPRSDGSTCSGSSDQTGSVPGVLSTYVIPSVANRREVPPGEEATWEEPEVELLITANPSQVKDTVRTIGCDDSDSTSTSSSRWQNRYNIFHEDDEMPIRGTKADRSADLMYAKTWENSVHLPNHLGGEDWNETTVLEIWHKPLNPAS